MLYFLLELLNITLLTLSECSLGGSVLSLALYFGIFVILFKNSLVRRKKGG
jgi:hypothetical protein